MDKTWRPSSDMVIKVLYMLCLVSSSIASKLDCDSDVDKELKPQLKRFVDGVLSVFEIIPGVAVEDAANATSKHDDMCVDNFTSMEEYVVRRGKEFFESHVVEVDLPRTARALEESTSTGRNSFLTGFGMGFLAFALKKLLLPVFIGAQLLKSMMIAMFLPSILGGFGKLLGKGLSTFSGISAASTGLNQQPQPMEDFEFKDTDPYSNDGAQDFGTEGAEGGLTLNVASSSTVAPAANSRFGIGHNRIYASPNDNYYMRKPNKKTDFKVFHKIPPSSLLLTSYDPFYSPLLSRLDAVFQQLGLGNDKSPETEKCRERLVCLMYANPAKYAPYSNLVSAQLSRELNELRKPASDNPDILRFFRYMKAAKDGQDGDECLAHGGCSLLKTNQASPAILTTYNDINKLVLARKMN